MQTRGNSHPAAPAMDWTFHKIGRQVKRLEVGQLRSTTIEQVASYR